ncbi:MAG: AAA family ATPase [Lawsonibacter sp.]|nr:AAA family ATPase [Lawsonibacter sp.]
MSKLTGKLFGSPQVSAEGRTLSLPYKKAEALLYYLLRKGRAARGELVGLLWPETDDQTAMKNLRHAVYSIRKELGWDPFLGGQRTVLELTHEAEIWCDVSEFLASGAPELYGGEFLKGFSVPKADGFEDWLSGERAMLRSRYLRGLLEAGQEAFQQGKLDQAEKLCTAYLVEDPMEENAAALLMRVCCSRQQFRRAIGLYHDLCRNLSSEYGVSPLKETTALYYKIADQWNASASQPEEPDSGLLVGKSQALQKLLSLCSAGERHAPCLLLEGEAGVGKTYLLDHFLAHYDLSDWLICRSFCYQTEAGGSLEPWNSIMVSLAAELELRHVSVPDSYIRTAADLFPGLAPDWECRLTAPDQDYPLQSNYYAAQRSALAIFSIAARQVPILLIFEDIHWMDRNSAQLLSAFLRHLREQDVAVICTSRDIISGHVVHLVEEGLRDKVLQRHMLRCFSREESRCFLRRCAGRELREELMDRIYQNTGGNALLLVQIADALAEKGDLEKLPQMPEDIITYRLSALSQDERRVLELVSIFAGQTPFDALSAILCMDILELTYLCQQLTQKKLLAESVRDGELEYCFAHEKIRAAVSRQQSESGRRLLHLRAARYLESRMESGGISLYNQLIYHYLAGGDRFQTFRYRILSLDAYAGLCYEVLPTLNEDSETKLNGKDELLDYFRTMETELAELRRFAGGETYKELNRLERMLLHAESRCCIHDGCYQKGLAVLERLLALCDAAGERRMAVQAHLQLVYYGIQTGDCQVMEEHLERIETLLRGEEDSADFGVWLRLSGLLEVMQGRYVQAREILARSIRTFQALDPDVDGRYAINIAGVYNYIAESYRLEQNYEMAFWNYDQAIAYNRSRGYYPGAALFYTNYGVAAYQSGRRAEAKKLFRYAVNIYEESHEYCEYPVALSYLALYDAQEGCLTRASERLTYALELCDAIGSPWWKGIFIYMTWKIRLLMERHKWICPELEALWPVSQEEHCLWCLSYLRRLQPRIETEEMEQELLRVTGGTVSRRERKGEE